MLPVSAYTKSTVNNEALVSRSAMEAMSVTSKLYLKNAPVVETALQIQFSDLPGWSTLYPGLYYPYIRERFPIFTHLPEIPPTVETFPASPKQLQFQFRLKQETGCAQYETVDSERLIRAQRNRFAYHWLSKSKELANYTSYEENLAICLSEFDTFSEFLQANSLPPVDPVLCEVMYLNHIRPFEGESLEAMVKDIFNTNLGSFELFTLNRTFVKEGRGRLYAELNTNFDDGSPFVTFQLTSRINHAEGDFKDSVNDAHDWLIDTFCKLTSPSARKDRWKEND